MLSRRASGPSWTNAKRGSRRPIATWATTRCCTIPRWNVVYIPLPNSQHREWTIKAAEHGKHVLCEKPMAMNAAECREMIAACAANGVTLMEAFMYRYSDRTRKVLEVLRSGELGDIKFISSSFRYLISRPNPVRLKPELGGGALYDVGCYPVNFIGMVMDEMARAGTGKPDATAPAPESVSVECVREDGVDMNLSAIVKYPGGVLASVNCGFTANLRLFSEIVGTKGVLEVPVPFFENPGNLVLTQGIESREIRWRNATATAPRWRTLPTRSSTAANRSSNSARRCATWKCSIGSLPRRNRAGHAG